MSIYDDVYKIRNNAAVKIFELLYKNDREPLPIEFYSVGITLHSMIGNKNPSQILSILSEISLSDEFKLNYTNFVSESFGNYDVVVENSDGISDKNIFKYLSVNKSKMGAWQAYLLYTLWHTLPLYDHSAYNSREYIFSAKDIESLYLKESNIKKRCLEANTNIIVLGINDYFYVSCCYWCRFRGLSRILCEIQIRDNRVINIREVNNTNLVEYGTDIRI